ncbi:MAG: YtxH domain-containing protein [Proteobacteria bacterium]|nr:YtxH domain-containing protein [Pseudomonadota bacterium]
MLNNFIKLGGSAMIIKELVDRVRNARNDREKAIRRNKAGALALGVSIGCTVGAVAGVLFAPKAGKETREDVGRRSKDAWEKIKDTTSSTGQRLVSAMDEKGSQVYAAAGKCVDAAKEVLHESVVQEEVAVPKKKEAVSK